MQSPTQHPHLRDAAILTRAIENVLRKLVRLFMGRISLARLQEMLRLVFVQEAEAFLKRKSPGKNVPMTKLAVLTGLDTRTLNRVKEDSEELGSIHESTRFLREITPECSILDYWQVNPLYIDPDNGKPLVLPLKGSPPSFDSLISDTLSARGVTAKSLLSRLEDAGAIKLNQEAGTVTVLEERFWPFHQEDDTAMLEIGLVSVGNLVDTLGHNLLTKGNLEKSYFHRATWTHRLPRARTSELRLILREILSNSEKQVTETLDKFEEKEMREDQTTVGACLFYFEEKPDG